MFTKQEGDDLLIILIYVDDGLIVGPRDKVDKIKNYLFSKFKMRDLGEAKKFLSFEIEKSKESISVRQRSFIEKIVDKFGMSDSKVRHTPLNAGTKELKINDQKELFEDVNLYQQAVGSLLFLANGTRPDISFAVGLMSRKLVSPSKNDWADVKSIISFLSHSIDFKISYFKKGSQLEGFCDASYADCLDSKSTSGYVFTMNGGAISWRSTKQKIVAASTMEAELISAFDAMKDALWLRKIEKDLKLPKHPVSIYCDNRSAVYWTNNNNHSDRSKHMSVRMRRLSEEIDNKRVVLKDRNSLRAASKSLTS